jgi:hypothetical protein
LFSGELEINGRRIFVFPAIDRVDVPNLKQPKIKIERTLKDIKKARHLG